MALAGCATQPLGGWVATWGASAAVPAPTAQAFDNQTLRLIAHPSIGGDAVRVRIANTFGTKPLVIGNVTIALQATGAATKQGSMRPVTFGGQTSTVIPPGALLVSDEVKLVVPAQQNLSVSIFISRDTGPATTHPVAVQTSYVSGAGDFSSSSDAAPFENQIKVWPFLSQIEVLAKKGSHTIVAFGDSITDGYQSTVDTNRRWPDELARRLVDAGYPVGVVSEAISGNRVLHDALPARTVFGPNGLSRFLRDALDVDGESHIIVLLGINDFGMGAASRNPDEEVSADQIIAGLEQFATRGHLRGIKVIGATLTPFGRAAYFSAAGEEKRLAVNAWIRSTKDFDGVVDFDAVVRDPNQPSQLRAEFDSGDHLHPSDAGYLAMGNSIALSLFK